MLGLVHEQTGELDKAIGDYTREMALNPLGRARLADAYCERGSFNHKEKKYDAADGCSCDPYNPLIALYDSVGRQYDKSWDIVHKAQRSRRWIMPESLERLKKDSGRNS
jgi:hypothetical protein